MKEQTFGKLIPATSASSFAGFVYMISVQDRHYIGKKSFRKGSDWRTYQSSNKEIKELLKQSEGSYQVLAYAETERHLTYLEAKFLFSAEALENPCFVNGNILGKFYRSRLR